KCVMPPVPHCGHGFLALQLLLSHLLAGFSLSSPAVRAPAHGGIRSVCSSSSTASRLSFQSAVFAPSSVCWLCYLLFHRSALCVFSPSEDELSFGTSVVFATRVI